METAPKAVNIIIADEYFYTARGIKTSCTRSDFFNNVHIVTTRDELFNVPVPKAHILLFNYHFEGFNTDTDFEKLQQQHPGIKLIAYTRKAHWQAALLLKNKNINGYILENTDRIELEKYFTLCLNGHYVSAIEITIHFDTHPPPDVTLKKQWKIDAFLHLIHGCGIKKIPRDVPRAESTNYGTGQSIRKSFGVDSVEELIIKSYKEGWVHPDDPPPKIKEKDETSETEKKNSQK